MDWDKVLEEAHEAAEMAELKEIAIRPENPYALDCGFAWVTIDGNSPLARFCRKKMRGYGKGKDNYREAWIKYGDKGYPSGWQWWKPGEFNGQSIRIHEVGSRAFRDVLANYGYAATVGSRLD